MVTVQSMVYFVHVKVIYDNLIATLQNKNGCLWFDQHFNYVSCCWSISDLAVELSAVFRSRPCGAHIFELSLAFNRHALLRNYWNQLFLLMVSGLAFSLSI
jgi:hypothetical protein